MRSLSILFGIVLSACAASDATSPAPASCPASLGEAAGADLDLRAGAPCNAALRLTLRVATGDPAAPAWHAAAGAPLTIEGGWTLDGADAVRTVKVVNHGTAAVDLVGLEWSTGNDGLALEADRILNNGYQSWSYTGFLPIPAHVSEALGTAEAGGDDESTTDDRPGTAWWWTALSSGGGRGLVAGALTARVFKTFFAADGAGAKRLRIVSGMNGDALRIGPGESVALDGLYLRFGALDDGFRAYAARVAAANGARTGGRLGGWGSWNVYYDQPTAALLREDMTWAKAKLVPAGLTDFLLDDGYEPRWGEWSAKPAFGATLDELNAEQAALGMRPAVWTAPFYVHTDAALVAAHPDWFVRDEAGALRVYDNITARYAALDVSNPGAVAFVKQTIADYKAWGYKTLKIDFLFGGAIPGARAKAITSMQSYQAWMKIVREAAGDLHLVGCGAPLLPSVGWVDSMRTGPDIAFVVFPEPRYPFLLMQARNTAARWFTDAWWAVDPDVILLRGNRISDDEAWTAVVAGAMAGGNYLLGDGRQASSRRQAMALDPEILALRDGTAAAPRDWDAAVDESLLATPIADLTGKSVVPHVWEKRGDAHTWLAVFGWNEINFAADVRLPAGAVEIVAPASGGAQATTQAAPAGRIAVEPHAVRLFRY